MNVFGKVKDYLSVKLSWFQVKEMEGNQPSVAFAEGESHFQAKEKWKERSSLLFKFNHVFVLVSSFIGRQVYHSSKEEGRPFWSCLFGLKSDDSLGFWRMRQVCSF